MPEKELVLQIDNKHLRENLRNDELILQILKEVKIPLTLSLISHISGLNKCSVLKTMTSLEKFGLVKKSTIQRAIYYTIKSKSEEKNAK